MERERREGSSAGLQFDEEKKSKRGVWGCGSGLLFAKLGSGCLKWTSSGDLLFSPSIYTSTRLMRYPYMDCINYI